MLLTQKPATLILISTNKPTSDFNMLRVLFFCILTVSLSAQNWNQFGGPDGSGSFATSKALPTEWSAISGKNIKWSIPLPETGQSGLAINGDKIFLTVYKELPEGDKLKNAKDIEGHCYSKIDGKLLWKCELKGSKDMKPTCPYGDSTTATPVTDGKHVWFYNSSGSMGCWTIDGTKVWFKEWTPRPIDPYTRRFQPFISGNLIYHILPEKELRPGEKKLWCFLHASNKLSGEHIWKAEDAVTVHNVPRLTKHNGKDAIYIGRGGPHKAPEKPYGLSKIDAQTGKVIWRYESPKSFATVNQLSEKYAFIMEGATPHKPTSKIGYMHLIDPNDGQLVKKIPLTQTVTHRKFDIQSGNYVTEKVKLQINMVRFSGVFHNGNYWFVNSNESIGKINLETGKIELLEVPVHKNKTGYIWKKLSVNNEMLNSRGIFAAGDKRSALSGWSKGNTRFWPMPTALNDKIYITALTGLTYVIDSKADFLDEKSLISVNDLGPAGKSWSGNPLSYSDGMIFHRSMKELYCIQNKDL